MISWFRARKLNKAIKNKSSDGLARLAENINNSFDIETNVESSWANVSSRLDAQPLNKGPVAPSLESNLKTFVYGPSKKIAAVLAGFSIIFSSLNFASAKTLPGDFFYPYKVLSEKAKLTFSIGQLNKANELLRQSREKLREEKEEEKDEDNDGEKEEEEDYLFGRIEKNITEIRSIIPSLSIEDRKTFVPKFNEFLKEYEKFNERFKNHLDKNTNTKSEINEQDDQKKDDGEYHSETEESDENKTSSEQSRESSDYEQKTSTEDLETKTNLEKDNDDTESSDDDNQKTESSKDSTNKTSDSDHDQN